MTIIKSRWANKPSPGDALFTCSFNTEDNLMLCHRVYWYGMRNQVYDADEFFESATTAIMMAYSSEERGEIIEAGLFETGTLDIKLRLCDITHLGTLLNQWKNLGERSRIESWKVFDKIILLWKVNDDEGYVYVQQ